jgi:hypothetical protein
VVRSLEAIDESSWNATLYKMCEFLCENLEVLGVNEAVNDMAEHLSALVPYHCLARFGDISNPAIMRYNM